MLIRSVKIKNLLSFGPDSEPIELKPLNVIIGPNGSGKSNFIDAISLLQSAPKELSFPVREGGGIQDWLWKGSERFPIAGIDVVIDNPQHKLSLRYILDFTESAQRFELVDEKIENSEAYPRENRPYFYYKFESGESVISICTDEKEGKHQRKLQRLQKDSFDIKQSILSQRKDPGYYPEITYLGDVLGKIRIYRDWSFGRYTPPRLPQKADLPNIWLEESCNNLGLVLNKLSGDAAVKKRLLKNLNALYEGIDDYGVQIEAGTVQVFFHEGRFTIPATRLSDGTLRYLCLLAVLCDPTPPKLVCIEEPELGLHPDVFPTLANILREASQRTQIVVTTHSDVLVDQFSDEPDSVIVCEKHDGSTTMKRLEKDSLFKWLEKYALGEIWRMGEIGGKRW